MTESPWVVPVADVEDLRARLRATRWPQAWPVVGWAAGVDLSELRDLVRYWAEDFDWAAAQHAVNDLPHRFADVGGQPVHYLRFDAETDAAPAIALSNGWPSSFFEMTALARRLAEPSQFGLAGQTAFTTVVPSIPGYGFSPQRPTLPADRPTHEL